MPVFIQRDTQNTPFWGLTGNFYREKLNIFHLTIQNYMTKIKNCLDCTLPVPAYSRSFPDCIVECLTSN